MTPIEILSAIGDNKTALDALPDNLRNEVLAAKKEKEESDRRMSEAEREAQKKADEKERVRRDIERKEFLCIETRTEKHWSGQPWDDGDIETIRCFKKSGVFLTEEEVKDLEVWLTYYVQFMNAYDKEKRWTETAEKVKTFLRELMKRKRQCRNFTTNKKENQK